MGGGCHMASDRKGIGRRAAVGHGADDSGLERRVLGGTSAVALRATLPTSPSTLSAVRMFRCFLDGNSSLRHRRDLWSLWRVLRLVRKQLFPACVGLSALRCSSAHQSPPSLLDSRYSSLLKGLPAPPHAALLFAPCTVTGLHLRLSASVPFCTFAQQAAHRFPHHGCKASYRSDRRHCS